MSAYTGAGVNRRSSRRSGGAGGSGFKSGGSGKGGKGSGNGNGGGSTGGKTGGGSKGGKKTGFKSGGRASRTGGRKLAAGPAELEGILEFVESNDCEFTKIFSQARYGDEYKKFKIRNKDECLDACANDDKCMMASAGNFCYLYAESDSQFISMPTIGYDIFQKDICNN